MAHEFRLPDIGEGLVEAQIVRWIVPVGGEVQVDQPVVEVETDKTVVELPSPYAGVVLHHGAGEGETLAVGEVLVVVGQAGETWGPGAGGAAAGPQPGRPNGDEASAGPVGPGSSQAGRPSGGAAPAAPRRGGDAPPIVGSLSEEAQDLTRAAPSPASGAGRPQALPKVRRLARELGVDLAAVGATGPKGRLTEDDVMAAAGSAGAAAAPGDAGPGAVRRSRSPEGPSGPVPQARGVGRDAVGATAPLPSPAARGAQWLSPVVRRLANELGVDLGSVAGTGPGGRVTRDDVLMASAASAAGNGPTAPAPVSDGAPGRRNEQMAGDPLTGAAAARGGEDAGDGRTAGGPSAGPPCGSPGDERRRLSPMRRAIAANVTRSWTEIPQVTAFDEVDAARLLSVRKALQARHDVKLPVDALLVAAVVPALRAFPELNARLEGDELVLLGRQDVGIAVDTPDGLLVAVLRDAGGKDLLDLAAEVQRLGERGRARALVRADLSGQGFTISNIGGVGGGWGTPLVPWGTVGILSVGQARYKPVVRDGKVEVAPVMPLSLSYDHRVIDGATGRRFLAMVVENLAEPALFLA